MVAENIDVRLLFWIGLSIWTTLGFLLQLYVFKGIGALAFGYQYSKTFWEHLELVLFTLLISVLWFLGPYVLLVVFFIGKKLGLKHYH